MWPNRHKWPCCELLPWTVLKPYVVRWLFTSTQSRGLHPWVNKDSLGDLCMDVPQISNVCLHGPGHHYMPGMSMLMNSWGPFRNTSKPLGTLHGISRWMNERKQGQLRGLWVEQLADPSAIDWAMGQCSRSLFRTCSVAHIYWGVISTMKYYRIQGIDRGWKYKYVLHTIPHII